MPDTPNTSSSPSNPPPRPRLSRRLRLPEVSGKWTVILLLVCFVLTGVLIPLILKLPKWVEFEIVVGTWWVLWTLILTKLLYAGEQISDDHQHHKPRDWFGLNKGSSGGNWDPGCGGGADAEGCLILVGLVVALLLVWILIEFAIPILFLMLYFLIRGMLVRVVNDKPQCQGDLGLSAFRGVFWATVYTAPLFATIWLVHWVHLKRG